MIKLLEKGLNLRKGELAVTLLMFFYYYLLLVTYYFLKPARDSLFLVKLGSSQLPFVFILIAVIVAPLMSLYSKAGQKLKLNKLINITTVIFIINLFILRWMVQFSTSWVYYIFYVWVSIYGVVSTSQFWLYANAVYNPAQAKRLFVLLTLGGIIGAFTGGEVTSLVVTKLGVATENLLFFCVGYLTVCIFLVNIIWKITTKERRIQTVPLRKVKEKKEGIGQMYGIIKRSRHLIFIVGLITMTMMVASFVDFQFKTVSLEAFPEKGDLTSFLGKFYGRLSLVSLIFQSVFAYTLLRVLGVGSVILFLPVGLLFGSLVMVLSPGLLAGIILRGADGSFKYSIDKTGRELLFMPVPLEIKKRTKVFIDVVVDRGARGIAGVLLLISLALGLSVRHISVIVIAFLLIWIVIGIFTKREYLNAFRLALSKREIDPDQLRININEVSTINSLKSALKNENDRQVEYALDMLGTVKKININQEILSLLDHKNSKIRLKSILILQSRNDKEYVREIEDMVNDSDPDVQLAAMHYIYIHSGDVGESLMKRFLEHSDKKVVSTTVRCIAEYGKPEHKYLLNKEIFKQLIEVEGDDGEICRVQLAKALGALNKTEFYSYLKTFMDDPSPAVVRQAIKSAGSTGDREFIPILLKKLADKQFRLNSRDALAEYGINVLGTLRDNMLDDSVEFIIRKNIPGVLSRIPLQESVNILTASITSVDPSLKYYIVKALSKLRSKFDELKFDKTRIDSALMDETMNYCEILNIIELRKGCKESPSGKLLEAALKEKLDKNLEQIFRLLGLRYPSKDIYNAYNGIISDENRLSSSAVEFLDNVISSDLKKYILPILETDSPKTVIQHSKKLFNIKIENLSQAIETLIKGKDTWLKACAIYVIPEENLNDLKSLVKEALLDRNPIVRETAELVAKRI
ncbi:Npt1/Npt2 family nucleotide transporter [Candidatus Latescibacterota bacterium]